MAIALKTGRGKDFARLIDFVKAACADKVKLHEILQRHSLGAAWNQFERNYLNP